MLKPSAQLKTTGFGFILRLLRRFGENSSMEKQEPCQFAPMHLQHIWPPFRPDLESESFIRVVKYKDAAKSAYRANCSSGATHFRGVYEQG
jgi:hypothetical protein